MSHNPGGPLPKADRELRTMGRLSSLTRGARAHLLVLQSPCLQLNCFLSVAISTIVHASTIPIRAPLPGIPPATTVFVPTALQCTATRSLPATVRSTVTLRSGMAARQDLVAALSCSRVYSAEAP